MEDVVLGRESVFEVATTDTDGVLVQPDDSALTFKCYKNGTLMGYGPTYSNPVIGKFFVSVMPSTGNFFEVNKSYSLFAAAIIGGKTYELPIARFFLRAYSFDAAVISQSGVRIRLVSPLNEIGEELSIVVGDAYNSDTTPLTFNIDGANDMTGKEVYLGIGPADGSYLIQKLGTVVTAGAGITQRITFELTALETALLNPDEVYRYNVQINYGTAGASPYTPVRGICTTQRKWT